MNTHEILYYPYASFGYEQAPFLRAAALYFDKIYLLDPVKARSTGTGPLQGIGTDINTLEKEGILVRLSPEEVLERYESTIEKGIRTDMQDADFIRICEQFGQADRWTLALAKVPKNIREDVAYKPKDTAMQRLMGQIPRDVAGQQLYYSETYSEVANRYREVGAYEETSLDTAGRVMEFREADFPLPLGESIMVNHALIGGLLVTGATPVTDDEFHHRVLAYKINRARLSPEVNRLLMDLETSNRIKANFLSMRVLQEQKLNLPAVSSAVPIERVLELRHKYSDELDAARRELAWLAQEIREGPWTEDFEQTVYHEYLPKRIRPLLEKCKKARRSWLKTTGLMAAAAGATIALMIGGQPLLSLATASTTLAVIGHDLVPLITDLRTQLSKGTKGKGYGLQYFMRVP
jgi:hypothetical protein